MRAFLISISLILLIAAVSIFGLGAVQKPSGAAYSTEGVRITSSNFHRITMGGSEGEDTCREINAWQTIFIDFGNHSEDKAACNS